MTVTTGVRGLAKRLLQGVGVDPRAFVDRFCAWSVGAAAYENGLDGMMRRLREIVPDMSAQESRAYVDSPFMEIKRRSLQATQCQLMLDTLHGMPAATIVDIGDSAGTHMLYMKALVAGVTKLETLSVNLDERAIAKIKARGLPAILCRAEDVVGRGIVDNVTLMTSFEMVEHLHDPVLFFWRLAQKSQCTKMIVSVPWLRCSRVGMHHIRHDFADPQYAEDVHVFELSPDDWTLLMLHAGWRVVESRIHYQYPRWPVLGWLLALFWRHYDYEGFWCAVLERDLSRSDQYQDWEE